jgi:hypothetical protein
MKKIIIVLLVLITMGCSKITVLEVAIREGVKQNTYQVMYKVERPLEADYVGSRSFYTTLGVHNFLTQVADVDLSGWEPQ